MFEAAKSKKSKTVLPNILKFSKTPKERADGTANADIIKNKTAEAFFLGILKYPESEQIEVSRRFIPEVAAAKNNKIKNISAAKLPHGREENISGIVINANGAPEFTSAPEVNTIGKIISPAVKAVKVSKNIIV